MELFEQILIQAELHIQTILAAGLILLLIIEEIHVIQLRKINRKLALAGKKLEKYLESVFDESNLDMVDELEEEGLKEEIETEKHPVSNDLLMQLIQHVEYSEGSISTNPKMDQQDTEHSEDNLEKQSAHAYSRQEYDMRNAIEQRIKQKNNTQLLDTVLQEIFD